MRELIFKYEKEIDWLNERLNTAIYMGDNQKIRIETELALLSGVISDLKELNKK